MSVRDKTKCPKCGGELELVRNYRMDFKMEIIPICRGECQMAWRIEELGWQINSEEPEPTT